MLPALVDSEPGAIGAWPHLSADEIAFSLDRQKLHQYGTLSEYVTQACAARIYSAKPHRAVSIRHCRVATCHKKRSRSR